MKTRTLYTLAMLLCLTAVLCVGLACRTRWSTFAAGPMSCISNGEQMACAAVQLRPMLLPPLPQGHPPTHPSAGAFGAESGAAFIARNSVPAVHRDDGGMP